MRCIDADTLEKILEKIPAADIKNMGGQAYVLVKLSQVFNVIDNQPTIEPQRKNGKWLPDNNSPYEMRFVCSECKTSEVVPTIGFTKYEPIWDFCPNCGAEMRTPVETARDIVHEAIDNSVWSDTVDTAKMHKVVDDKYAEIRGDANVDAES